MFRIVNPVRRNLKIEEYLLCIIVSSSVIVYPCTTATVWAPSSLRPLRLQTVPETLEEVRFPKDVIEEAQQAMGPMGWDGMA